MSTSRWRGWVLALAIFCLGVAVGGTAATLTGLRLLRRAFQAPLSARSIADRNTTRIGDDLSRSLQLTADQEREIRRILSESAAHMNAIRAQAAQQAAVELHDSTGKIVSALPAEKHDEFYRIIRKRYERLGIPPPK